MLLDMQNCSTATKYRPKTIPQKGEVWAHRRNLISFTIDDVEMTGSRFEAAKRANLRIDFLAGFLCCGVGNAYIPFSVET